MKRYLSLLLALLLLAALPMVALAAPAEPKLVLQPQNYCYPEYSVAVYTVKADGSNLRATWYIKYEGKTYCLSDNTNGMEPWESYAGAAYGHMEDGPYTFSWFFGGIEAGLDGAEIWCVIEDGHYEVTSAKAIITVQGSVLPPEILEMPVAITATQGGAAEARCVAKSGAGGQLSFQWYETSTGKLQNIRALDGEDSDYIFLDTSRAGIRYYVCCVTNELGGRAYSSVLPVTVTEAAPEAPEITTKTLPDAVAGEPYQATIKFTGEKAQLVIYYNPGGGNDFEKTGLALGLDGKISGTPTKPGRYDFAVCAAGAGGEDYATFTLVVNAPETAPETTEATQEQPQEATRPTRRPRPDTEETEPEEEDDPALEGMPWWALVIAGIAAAIAGAGITAAIVKRND